MSESDMAYMERMDRFLSGEEAGDIPIDLLRARGVECPPAESLDDAALHAKLWEVIQVMSEIGMVLEDTDHLSDRELYRFLVTDALLVPEILCDDGLGFCHVSPIGGFSNEDIQIYQRYYADERKERPPFDRDRFLPGR
jgi:hypothetical protein